MADLVDALRRTVQESDYKLGEHDVFELTAVECWACCARVDGGNKTCPPKLEVESVA
jgi:hypothetical protein